MYFGLVSTSINKKLHLLLKTLKNPNVELQIVQNGGKRVITIADTRWCTYRDAAHYILTHISIIRKLIIDKVIGKPFSKEVSDLIFDFPFFEELEKFVEVVDLIRKLINKCQSADCNIVEAAKMWLKLKVEPTMLGKRKKMALNIYAMTVLYLYSLSNTP